MIRLSFAPLMMLALVGCGSPPVPEVAQPTPVAEVVPQVTPPTQHRVASLRLSGLAPADVQEGAFAAATPRGRAEVFPLASVGPRVQAYFPDSAAEGVVVAAGNHSVRWVPFDADDRGAYAVGTDQVRYQTWPDVEERFTVGSSRVEHDFVVHGLGAVVEDTDLGFADHFELSGELVLSDGLMLAELPPFERAGDIELVSATGDTVFRMPAPWAYEAGDRAEAVRAIWRVTGTAEAPVLTVAVPMDWMNDSTRQFPVVVDPTLIEGSGAGTYGVVRPGADCASGAGAAALTRTGFLEAGFWDTSGTSADECERFAMRFDTSTIPDGATITKVELEMRLIDDAGGGDIDFGGLYVDPAVENAGTMWSELRPQNFDYVQNVVPSGTFVTDLGGDAASDVRGTLSDDYFAVGVHRGDHVLEFGNGSGTDRYLGFAAEGTADEPTLHVTYTTSPGIEQAVAANASGMRPGIGVDDGDEVVIHFNGSTNRYTVNASNIDTVLDVGASTWGTITSATWSTTDQKDDTLTIVLSSAGGPTVAGGDLITIPPGTIRVSGEDANGGILGGSFDAALFYFVDGATGVDPVSCSGATGVNDSANPFATIQGAIDCAWDNTGGDLTGLGDVSIRVAAGTYTDQVEIAGFVTSPADRLVIEGDPNGPKPVIDGGGTNLVGVLIDGVSWVTIRGLDLSNFDPNTNYAAGIAVDNALGVELLGNRIHDTGDFGIIAGWNPVDGTAGPAHDLIVRNNVIHDIAATGTDADHRGDCIHLMSGTQRWHVENNTLHDCEQAGIHTQDDPPPESDGTFRNNIVLCRQATCEALKFVGASGGQGNLYSDYNLVRIVDGVASRWDDTVRATITDHQAASGVDANSFDDVVRYADQPGQDYHLRSQAGRWDPGTSSWVSDGAHSPAIDAGDPATIVTDEPAPNGTRVNIGAYGNTGEASKSNCADTNWYADCDGDGFHDSAAVASCLEPQAHCKDGAPLGNWTQTAPATADCNDNDAEEFPGQEWYRDCDGDGAFRANGLTQCVRPVGICSGSEPAGGFTHTAPGTADCNDANAILFPDQEWYADCDSDGAFSGTVLFSCDAPSPTPCNGGSAPAGGWSHFDPDTGADCDDNDPARVPGQIWYPDCDGDGFYRDSYVVSCDQPFSDCLDFSEPDGGWVNTLQATTDCIDEDADRFPGQSWYGDCDGDGAFGAAVTLSCDSPDVPTSCVDTLQPDGGWTIVDPALNADCDDEDPGSSPGQPWYPDCDGDGYFDKAPVVACSEPTTDCNGSAPIGGHSTIAPAPGTEDCIDDDVNSNPAAVETCDTLDNDCDSAIDEGVTTTFFFDADSDGYGVATQTVQACAAPALHAAVAGDCDDADDEINPGLVETCDYKDNDCDLVVDEGVTQPYYVDSDLDTYGHPSAVVQDCFLYPGFSTNNLDCDDSRAQMYPGNNEVCDGFDNDCNGQTDEGQQVEFYVDRDGDGAGDPGVGIFACVPPSGYVDNTDDCNDFDPTVFGGNTETCDEKDNTCDGVVDEGVQTIYSRDADGDTFGDASDQVPACAAPAGYVADATDCDDTAATAFPQVTGETTCDGLDDDCNGTVDDGVKLTFYQDDDGDNHGANGATTTQACVPPAGFGEFTGDCDDNIDTVYPGATELCDTLDNDCNGQIDESLNNIPWYFDGDGDGYGAGGGVSDCGPPTVQHVDVDGDCNDGDADMFPGNPEVCDSKDNNCDTTVDEGVVPRWYSDADGDTFGDVAVFIDDCVQPANYVADDQDCDDNDNTSFPGGTETCDLADNDCNGTADDGVQTDFYLDADNDGYGDSTLVTPACGVPSGHSALGGDCNDGDVQINPGHAEICDNKDNDCDLLFDSDDPDVANPPTWYADFDTDGFGDAAITVIGCDQPTSFVADNTDCNDNDGGIKPGATEICNGVDDDCDTLIDDADPDRVGLRTYYLDNDGDTYGTLADTRVTCDAPAGFGPNVGDCNDNDVTIFPGAPDTPYDGIDQDCDGTDLIDSDGDGYIAVTEGGQDCNDRDPLINPDQVEIADGIDNDCNGLIDDQTDRFDDDGDGWTELGGDCDDTNADISPVAVELCDGIDNNCDNVLEVGSLCWDDDGDGYCEGVDQGNGPECADGKLPGDCHDNNTGVHPGQTEIPNNGVDDDCDGSVDGGVFDNDGDGYTVAGGDCDDSNPNIHPGALEIPNTKDDDCDGLRNEGTIYYDDDGDCFCEEFNPNSLRCNGSVNSSCTTLDEGDCNDADSAVHPDAIEVTNHLDDNCDGDMLRDPWEDLDLDGYTEAEGDCEPENARVHPAAEEKKNGRDDDCDGEVDEDFADVDQDGVSVADGDCDDTKGWIGPHVLEMCGDEIDNDCDKEIDEACDAGGVSREEPPEKEDTGCGCSSTPSSGSMMLPWILALALSRRRLMADALETK